MIGVNPRTGKRWRNGRRARVRRARAGRATRDHHGSHEAVLAALPCPRTSASAWRTCARRGGRCARRRPDGQVSVHHQARAPARCRCREPPSAVRGAPAGPGSSPPAPAQPPGPGCRATRLGQRGRHEGKTDRLDSHRVAVETQTNPRLARAFKHAVSAAPDSVRDRIALWHNARTSLTKVRVQLLGELDALVHDLPEDLRSQLRPAKTVSARVNSLRRLDTSGVTDPTVALRLRLIEHRVAMLRDVLEQDEAATAELSELVEETKSTPTELVGIAPRAAAEIILEVGDIRRFTEAGFARFNGTAPIPASSGEGENAPVRHRLSRGGNRRLNAAIYASQ